MAKKAAPNGRSRSWMKAWNIFAATHIQTATTYCFRAAEIPCRTSSASSSQHTQSQQPSSMTNSTAHTSPFHSRQQHVPNRLTTTPAGTTPSTSITPAGSSTTQSEPSTLQARRFAGGSALADATREQSATLPTSAGSQAVVETTLPRPANMLRQWPCEL